MATAFSTSPLVGGGSSALIGGGGMLDCVAARLRAAAGEGPTAPTGQGGQGQGWMVGRAVEVGPLTPAPPRRQRRHQRSPARPPPTHLLTLAPAQGSSLSGALRLDGGSSSSGGGISVGGVLLGASAAAGAYLLWVQLSFRLSR